MYQFFRCIINLKNMFNINISVVALICKDMPIYIDGKRIYNRAAWLEHKKLVRELILYSRFVKGGHPEIKQKIESV